MPLDPAARAETRKLVKRPKGYGAVTPYLIVDGVPRLVEFLEETFNAQEKGRINTDDGRVGHCEVEIDGSIVMMADSNQRYRPIPSQLYVYVDNVDATYKRGLNAGGVSQQEPKTQIYGDRTAAVRDPTGNVWWIATHVEEVSEEEMENRMREEGLRGDALTPSSGARTPSAKTVQTD